MTLDLGKIIKKGLMKKVLKQNELAKSLGVSPATVSEWVANKKKPSTEVFLRLIYLLDLKEDLFPSKENKKQEVLSVELNNINAKIIELASRVSNLELCKKE